MRFAREVGEFFDGLKDKLDGGAEELLANAGDAFKGAVDGAGDAVASAFGNAGEAIDDAVGGAVDNAGDAVASAFGNAGDALGDSLEDLQDAAGDFAKEFKNAFYAKMDELDDKFEDLSGDIQFGGCSHLYPSHDFEIMEWAAWTMVFIPLISMIINFICIKRQAKEPQEGEDKSSPAQKPANHASSVGIVGILSMIAGILFLVFYFNVKDCDESTFGTCWNQTMLKWHVGMTLAVVVCGAICSIFITVIMIMLLCSSGGEDCLAAVCFHIFLQFQITIIFTAPVVAVAYGWDYTFGSCEIFNYLH